jgi:phosphate transport system substrate-binding protein
MLKEKIKKKHIITLAIIGIYIIFFTWTAIGLLFGEQINEINKEQIITIHISGSTTCFPAILACAEDFEQKEENYDISVSGGGSSKGITDVINGLVDLGMASRPLKSSEQVDGIYQLPFANDGIALIMSAGNKHFSNNLIPQWTMTDVLKIFNGTYRYWKEVPGCTGNEQIILIGRDSNSGTRASFEEITKLDKDEEYGKIISGTHEWQTIQELNSNGAVHDAVAANQDTIGYVGLGYIDNKVDSIDLGFDGIHFYEPNAVNVKSGDYPLSRQLYIIYRYEISKNAKPFVNFILGSKGQAIIESEGFVGL